MKTALVGILTGAAHALAALIIFGFPEREQPTYKLPPCKLAKREETGQMIYCGRACFRPEVREVWACPGRTVEVVR